MCGFLGFTKQFEADKVPVAPDLDMETIHDVVFILTVLMTEDKTVVIFAFVLFVAYMFLQGLLTETEGGKEIQWWNSSPPVYT